MTRYFRSFIEVNLTKLAENYNYLSSILTGGAKAAAVVKANAYGLGALKVSQHLKNQGCRNFFVSTLDEALEIKPALKNCNIYILTGVHPLEVSEVKENNFIAVIGNYEQLKLVKHHGLQFCLKFNTGMGRLGFKTLDAPKIADEIAPIKHNLHYVISHLNNAEDINDKQNPMQLERFGQIMQNFTGIKASLSNSAGVLLGGQYQYQLVRPGAYLYGICMAKSASGTQHMVATKYSEVIHKYIADKDERINYGNTYRTHAGQKIMIVRIGYADCYLRQNSNKSYMFAYGHKLPVIGNVTMDMTALDASKLTDKQFAECNFVEVFGNNVTISELASLNNTIGYEILTGMGMRFDKKYIS